MFKSTSDVDPRANMFQSGTLSCTSINNMPTEILLHIFSFLYLDFTRSSMENLLNCELVCHNWKDILSASLWPKLCHRLLLMQGMPFARGYSELSPTYTQHQFIGNIIRKEKCKWFYLKLLNLSKRWKLRWNEGSLLSPKVTSIDITHCPKFEGNAAGNKEQQMGSETSVRWQKTHNYAGIYDMVYIKEKSILVASVNDCIQVWNVSGDPNGGGYNRINMITPTVLDADENEGGVDMVSCFYVTEGGTSLVCGTENSKLKLFDLSAPGGRLVETYWVNGVSPKKLPKHKIITKDRLYVSDVRIRRSTLIALDWYGKIYEWNVASSETSANGIPVQIEKLTFVRALSPNVGPFREWWNDETKSWWQWMQGGYHKRFSERLLDFSDDAIILTKNTLLCVLPRNSNSEIVNDAVLWIKAPHPILCCKIVTICQKEERKLKRQTMILCGQQEGTMEKYTLNEEMFNTCNGGGFTYVDGFTYYHTPVSGSFHNKIYPNILSTDANNVMGGIELHCYRFQTFWKSPVTSITSTFIPLYRNETETGEQSNHVVIVGDRNGEIYFLDGETLVRKFHIGYIHSGSYAYACPRAEGPPLDTQGTTYGTRGRLPENTECNETDCIIWSVQADTARLFSGDSNGMLVVHDFWNYIDCESTNLNLNSDGQHLVENSLTHDCDRQRFLAKRSKLE